MKLVYFTNEHGSQTPRYEVFVCEATGRHVDMAELIQAIRQESVLSIRQASAAEQGQFIGAVAITDALTRLEQGVNDAFRARPGLAEAANKIMFDAITGVIKSCPTWGSLGIPGNFLTRNQGAA